MLETERSHEIRGTSRSHAVRFEGVSKRFGAVIAVDDLDLEVADGEFFSLLGPSGSGKTTCLRLIAGFESPTSGRILLHGDDVTKRAPFQRDVNTVFQDYALFPHMTVDDNVAYGMVVKRVPKSERRERVEEALRLVRLVGLGGRKPAELSGGQRQRVALARALVNRPQVLLLDEPLGALDLKLRQEMQIELKALQREVGITFLFVTHDQEEALTMSDRIAVFNNGRIEQVGTPGEVYEQPSTAFVAGFVGTSNLLSADRAARLLGIDSTVTVRPEKIRIVEPATPIAPDDYGVDGRVRDIVYLGALTRYLVELDAGFDMAVVQQNLDQTAASVLAVKGRQVSLLAVMAVLAAACGDDDNSASDTTTTVAEIGEGEGKVSIVAWPGYIERGETDPAYDWVTAFEEETGCKVSVKTAATSDEMVSLMTGSDTYDLVTASGDASLRLIAGDTVQPVNLDLIPEYADVDERLQGGAWYTVDGQAYGVPFDWGANVLAYNTEVFPTAPTSWGVVFEEQNLPDGKSNKGRVQAYDGAIYIADAALYLKATNPDLGIDDPYALNQAQFDAAVDLVKTQHALVNSYWHDVTKQVEDFTGGGTVASSTWPYQVNTLVAAKEPVASVVPEEGATGWADTTMLATNAPHPNCAYQWMRHSLDPKVQGDLAAWFGSVPAVPAACEGNELLTDEGCATNGFDEFDQIEFWKTPEADCFGEGGECVPYSTWVDEYDKVKAG